MGFRAAAHWFNEKCPPRAPLFEHMVSSWWRYLSGFRGVNCCKETMEGKSRLCGDRAPPYFHFALSASCSHSKMCTRFPALAIMSAICYHIICHDRVLTLWNCEYSKAFLLQDSLFMVFYHRK